MQAKLHSIFINLQGIKSRPIFNLRGSKNPLLLLLLPQYLTYFGPPGGPALTYKNYYPTKIFVKTKFQLKIYYFNLFLKSQVKFFILQKIKKPYLRAQNWVFLTYCCCCFMVVFNLPPGPAGRN